MHPKTRCKFVVTEVRHTRHNAEVTLEARYDPELNKEDHAFCTATPIGKLVMNLYGEAQVKAFSPGEAYYLDFTLVPAATP